MVGTPEVCGSKSASKPLPFWARPWAEGDIEYVDGVEYRFSEDYAQRIEVFFERYLKFTEGDVAGKNFQLQPWQRRMLRTLFGWRGPDGLRRFRTLFLYIPRKNGKTELAAGIALYLLAADNERGAQVYCAAANEEQARVCFDKATQMVRLQPYLAKRLKPYRKTIYAPDTNSRLKVVNAKDNTKHGFSASGVIVDELHAYKNRELMGVLTSSMGARRQPLTVITTTAPAGRETVCYEEYKYAKQVLSGDVADPTYLPVIFEVGVDEDWTDESTWARANPNLGVSVSIEFLRNECRKAKRSARLEGEFKRYYLNIVTEQATRWIAMEEWRKLAGPTRTPAWHSALVGRRCFAGVDMSSTTDLTAAALVFPRDDGLWYDAILRFWVPEKNVADRVRRDNVPYDDWIAQGYITATKGSSVDQDAVLECLTRWHQIYNLKEIAFDRWEATAVINKISRIGATAFAHGQHFGALSIPCKALERCVLSGQLGHGGNPVLEWNMRNCAIATDDMGNIKPVKGKSADRIDGVVALVMALGRAVSQNVAAQSAYARPGKELVVIRRVRPT